VVGFPGSREALRGHRVNLSVDLQVDVKENPMALDKSALQELLDALRAGGDIDVVRSGMQLVLQALWSWS
jgi:hypothetical protein